MNIIHHHHHQTKKPKVIFIMGATGTGKSKLSVDIAKRFPSEIINSDKIQAYHGLDILTNKLPLPDRAGIPHHLLGIIPDPSADFPPSQFRSMATASAAAIAKLGKTPIIVGGSNSYLEALVDLPFLAAFDCLFLWLDADLPLLFSYVDERVDQMVEQGLVEEVTKFLDPAANLSRGIWRAIGVPEFAKCFDGGNGVEVAVEEMKENTRRLVCRQREKIRRLREERGWEMTRIDASEVFRRRADLVEKEAAWEELVMAPVFNILDEFIVVGAAAQMERETDNYLTSPPIFVL